MTVPVGPPGSAAAGLRHPDDPDPVPSTAALAVLVLGVVAVVTGPLIAGLVPGTVALLLARDVGRQLEQAGGFLLGARRVRIGVRLSWCGIALAAATMVVAMVAGLLTLAEPGGGQDYAPVVD